MIYSELLNRAFLRDVTNPSDSDDDNLITLMPKGAAPGIDFDVVISRNDFEEAFTRGRRDDPIFEAILTEIAPAQKRPVRDRFWKIFTGVQAFKDAYAKLVSKYLEEGLNIAATKENVASADDDSSDGSKNVVIVDVKDAEYNELTPTREEPELESPLEIPALDEVSSISGIPSNEGMPFSEDNPAHTEDIYPHEDITQSVEDDIQDTELPAKNVTFDDGFSLAPPDVSLLPEDNLASTIQSSEECLPQHMPSHSSSSPIGVDVDPLDNAEMLMGFCSFTPPDTDISSPEVIEDKSDTMESNDSSVEESITPLDETATMEDCEIPLSTDEEVSEIGDSNNNLESEVEPGAVVSHSSKSAEELLAGVDTVITDLLSSCSKYGIPLVLYGDKNAKKCVRRFAVTIAENVPPLTKILMESDSIKDSIKNLAYLCSLVRNYCEPLAKMGDEESIDKILEPIVKAIYQ